jgi:hypothetical protein
MLTLDNPKITQPFKDKTEFSIYIESYAIEKGVSLMVSLLQYCEDADIDIANCSKYISESLKQKVEQEAIDERYMTRKQAPLPFF